LASKKREENEVSPSNSQLAKNASSLRFLLLKKRGPHPGKCRGKYEGKGEEYLKQSKKIKDSKKSSFIQHWKREFGFKVLGERGRRKSEG